MKQEKQIMIEPPQTDINKRQPLLKRKVGEIAGGMAAECAAVCCCCPCALVNFLVLAMYKVPTGLCKKAMRKRKQKSVMLNKNKTALVQRHEQVSFRSEIGPSKSDGKETDYWNGKGNVDAVDLESEMWENFYNRTAGFWRNSSVKDD